MQFKLVGEANRPRLRKSLEATLRASLPYLSSQLTHEVPIPRLPKSHLSTEVKCTRVRVWNNLRIPAMSSTYVIEAALAYLSVRNFQVVELVTGFD